MSNVRVSLTNFEKIKIETNWFVSHWVKLTNNKKILIDKNIKEYDIVEFIELCQKYICDRFLLVWKVNELWNDLVIVNALLGFHVDKKSFLKITICTNWGEGGWARKMLGTIALDSKLYRFGSLQYKTQKINLKIFNCIYWSKICSLFSVLKNK